MSILIDNNSRVIVQGITGRDGAFHAALMKKYGTNIVAGTSPGKGNTYVNDIPVFDTMQMAVNETNADTSVIFVPARFAADAICEASDAGIGLVIAITEGIPIRDMMQVISYLKKNGTNLIGPNCPGLISPGRSKAGILPGNIFKPGRIGLMSRSGTLTYEIVNQISDANLGQSTCIGIGGDPIIGLGYIELLEMFENDHDTDAIVLVGEIGGDAEEKAAEFIRDKIRKPVIAFIAGRTAPRDKRMGHAGAIIASGSGTADEKIEVFRDAGIPVAKEPAEITTLINELV